MRQNPARRTTYLQEAHCWSSGVLFGGGEISLSFSVSHSPAPIGRKSNAPPGGLHLASPAEENRNRNQRQENYKSCLAENWAQSSYPSSQRRLPRASPGGHCRESQRCTDRQLLSASESPARRAPPTCPPARCDRTAACAGLGVLKATPLLPGTSLQTLLLQGSRQWYAHRTC